MKILVTGAAGFIGSHMAEFLVNAGHEVYGVDNFSDYYDIALKKENYKDIVAAGAHFIETDLVHQLEEILPKDIDIVYHFAAQPGISLTAPFELYERNNVTATQSLLEWALQLKKPLKSFINIATSSIYGIHATSTENETPMPASDYGVTKLAAEQLVLEAYHTNKLNACSIRLYSVYGPRERPEKLYTKLIKAIIEEKPFPLFEGSKNHERSFTYVGDIVEGLAVILDHLEACNGEIINLGSEAVYTTGDGIKLVETILNKSAILQEVKGRQGEQLKTAANISKAKKILNYEPKTSFREGLEAQVAWYKNKFVSS